MKFILASRWFFPDNQGGIAMHNGYLTQALKEMFDLSLISLPSPLNFNYYQQLGVPLSYISNYLPLTTSYLAKVNIFKNYLRSYADWKISLNMSKIIEAASPDIVEFMDIHSEGYAFLKRNPKDKRSTKVVIRSHTPWGILRSTYLPYEIRGVDGWRAKEREFFCFHNCDAISAPSEDMKKQLIEVYNLPKEKITVMPNLLDTDHFSPLNMTVNPGFTFLHVGRFERAKGVVTMTKAFIETIKRSGQDVRLINVGEPRGSALQQCFDLLEAANLKDKVTFTGFVPYEDLPKYYSKANAVIVPSEIYESFSYTVAQAVACGKPVIASTLGGIPETVGYGKYGTLFMPGNYHDLANKMMLSLDKQDLNIDELASYAKKKFSIKELSNAYTQFYQNI